DGVEANVSVGGRLPAGQHRRRAPGQVRTVGNHGDVNGVGCQAVGAQEKNGPETDASPRAPYRPERSDRCGYRSDDLRVHVAPLLGPRVQRRDVAAVAPKERRRTRPSVEPNRSSLARSGWGMRPTMLPSGEQM